MLKATRLRTFATGSPAKISVRSRFARTQLLQSTVHENHTRKKYVVDFKSVAKFYTICMSRVFWEFLRLRQVGGRPSFKNNLVPSKRSVTNS